MNDIIDSRKFTDNLKDKIKTEFINLIPEEQWSNLINETTQKFMEDGVKKVIESELEIHIRKYVKDYLTHHSEYIFKPLSQQSDIDDHIKKLMVDLAPAMLTSMFSGAAYSVMQSLNNNIPRY